MGGQQLEEYQGNLKDTNCVLKSSQVGTPGAQQMLEHDSKRQVVCLQLQEASSSCSALKAEKHMLTTSAVQL